MCTPAEQTQGKSEKKSKVGPVQGAHIQTDTGRKQCGTAGADVSTWGGSTPPWTLAAGDDDDDDDSCHPLNPLEPPEPAEPLSP